MGLLEWLALITLLMAVVGSIIKGYTDKANLETKLQSIEKWKDKMDSLDYLPTSRCLDERRSCKESVYKDLNRIERRFEELYKISEIQNTKIGEVRENVIKILTLLENKKEN